MLEMTVSGETGDAWMSVEVPPEVILVEWDNKNEFWRFYERIFGINNTQLLRKKATNGVVVAVVAMHHEMSSRE
jgi:hypothetical protein